MEISTSSLARNLYTLSSGDLEIKHCIKLLIAL